MEIKSFLPYIYGEDYGGWVQFGEPCKSLEMASFKAKKMCEKWEDDNESFCCSGIHPIKFIVPQ